MAPRTPYSGHERLIDDGEIRQASPRAFGFVFATAFGVVALWPLLSHGRPRGWSLAVAAMFGLLALLRPTALATASHLWQKVGLAIHAVVNPIVMGLLFYLVVTPFGVAARWAGKGLGGTLRRDPEAATYWRQRTAATSDMRNQF